MKPTNGMDRGQFHDKAWALWQAKALGDAKLPKLSIYAIRTLWDVLFDSMPAESKVAQPVEQTRALTDEARDAERYRWIRSREHNGYSFGDASLLGRFEIHQLIETGYAEGLFEERLDSAIDAAMTAARPASGENRG